MNTSFTFTVFGIPQPQGSTRAFIPKGWTRAVITTANSKNKPWRQEMAKAALCAIQTYGFFPLMNGEAAQVDVKFFFDRPASLPKKIIHKVSAPDVDKLLRSVLDSLTGIAFKNDAQVVRCVGTKQFGYPARAVITVGHANFTEETCETSMLPIAAQCE